MITAGKGGAKTVSEEMLATTIPGAPGSAVKRPVPGRGWTRVVCGLILAVFVGAAWWFFARGSLEPAQPGRGKKSPASASTAATLRVDVITPRPRGLGRVVVQPGIVQA